VSETRTVAEDRTAAMERLRSKLDGGRRHDRTCPRTCAPKFRESSTARLADA
jgi:hypothetical protein